MASRFTARAQRQLDDDERVLLIVDAYDAQRAQRALRKLARRVQRRREAQRACVDGLLQYELQLSEAHDG